MRCSAHNSIKSKFQHYHYYLTQKSMYNYVQRYSVITKFRIQKLKLKTTYEVMISAEF